ncbi:hypothetical protein IC762_17805 [Bradyrhizobium genosp. L]|uniref:hypothetical protein n=1 Tax=Bradyrhizobium genosp. L TaxID=83637 RepID=UPI0018A29BFC|nr:hypothetical protein [Bradyrhizobium genosp. L]QPF81678.1 hypothetical protein IC762_17805 [Bradyrhizobium genosp. L]
MIIDELVLEFGLDSRNFSRNQHEVLEQLRQLEQEGAKSATHAERNAKNLTDMFATFRREAVGALGVFLGGAGIASFVSQIATTDATVGRLAQTMNMSAKELVAWQGAARTLGGSGEGVTGTLNAMTQDMNRFMLTGQGTLTQVLRPLGISIMNANGELKTAGELMEDLAQASQHMDPARFAALFQMLPGANQESLNLIINGRDSLRAMLDEQRRINNITPESIRLAKEYQKAVSELDTTFSRLGRTIAVELFPVMTGLAKIWADTLSGGDNSLLKIKKGSLVDRLHDSFSGAVPGLTPAQAVKDWWNANHPQEPAASDQSKSDNSAPGPATSEPPKPPTAGGTNWTNFLHGLSYLETSDRDSGNATSTAQGYFQFLKGTAARATKAGLPDPRYGSYDEQSDATKRYIERFYPQASAAIARGDYAAAEQMLKEEWPSLPGGSQQQNAARYSVYRQKLGGNSSTSSSKTDVHIGQVNVQTQATDARGIAQDIKPELDRAMTTSQFNTGLE